MLLINSDSDENNLHQIKSERKNGKKLNFLSRLKLCLMILVSGKYKPVLKFEDGTEIDFSQNKIKLTKPTHIHCSEDLFISSSKNIIIDSGKSLDPRRIGYNYGIWLNCPKDENNLPIKVEKSE